MPTVESKWFVTFGFGQPLENCYTLVPCDGNMNDAANKVAEVYGEKWAFLYPIADLDDMTERFPIRYVPFGTPNDGRPLCMGCLKSPKELDEYIEAARDAEMDVEVYVRKEEGTYNKFNGHFLCTSCYIEAGQPSSRDGWTCP